MTTAAAWPRASASRTRGVTYQLVVEHNVPGLLTLEEQNVRVGVGIGTTVHNVDAVDHEVFKASGQRCGLRVSGDYMCNECASLTASASGTPVVVLTAWVAADGRFRRLAFGIGCAAFIAKPCDAQVLVAVLRRVLEGERFIAIA